MVNNNRTRSDRMRKDDSGNLKISKSIYHYCTTLLHEHLKIKNRLKKGTFLVTIITFAKEIGDEAILIGYEIC